MIHDPSTTSREGPARIRVVGVGVEASPAGDGLLLRLVDEDGRVGWGEAAARAGFSGAVTSFHAGAGALAARLPGRVLAGVADVITLAGELAGLPSPLRYAAETALLDLVGQGSGASLAALLGAPAPSLARSAFLSGQVLGDRFDEGAGARAGGDPIWPPGQEPPRSLEEGAVARTGRRWPPGEELQRSLEGDARGPAGEVLTWPPGQELQSRSEEPGSRALAALRAAGFVAAKIKAPGPWPAALPGLVALARAAAAAGLALRVDCNGSMPIAAAPELLAALAAAGVDYVEEPCAGLDVAGWRALAAVGPALAVDESALADDAFSAHLEAGAAAVVILKPCFVGGLLAARERARAARARGFRVVVTSALEGPIGAAAAAHLALALGVDEPCGITLREGAAAPAWLDPRAAILRLPAVAGLGVEGPA